MYALPQVQAIATDQMSFVAVCLDLCEAPACLAGAYHLVCS